jgi:hypothetical protein
MRLPLHRALVAIMAVPAAGLAQTYTVTSITPITAFGEVAAAETGDTVFFQNNTTVTAVSGTGARIKGTVRRATVTIRCNASGSPNPCSLAANKARVTIGSLSNSGGRAKEFTEFIATGVTGTLAGTTTGSTLDFTVAGFTGNNNTRTFTLDTKLRVEGDNVGGTTGALTSTYYVYAALDPTVPSTGLTAAATITVRRSLRTVIDSNLNFGTLVRQTSGASGTVVINNTTGARTTGGTNPPIPVVGPAFGRTQVTITGEPSTTFAISYVPTGNLIMSSGANTLSVTLTKTNSGNVTMPATGTLVLGVGGTITVSPTTPYGQYSGTLVVNVAYN